MVSIIIPLLNNLDMTKECIATIEQFTPEPHEIIFVDNGSQDGTGQYLQFNMKPHWKLIVNDKNEGFPRACNQGMAVAEGEYVLLLNNDVLVSPEWLKGLLECINSADDIGIVGPKSNYVSGAQQVTEGTYSDADSYIEFAKAFRKTFKGCYLPRWRIVGFCFLFRKSLIDKIGYFDERFSPGNFEDDDYCLRAMEAGYRNMICSDVFIHHHGSKSHDPATFQQLLNTNQKKYEEKWDAAVPKKISTVMIVKDEANYITECIKSFYDHVDEVVVVDTGSIDITKLMAESCGEKVKTYDFEWCEDFSAARNFANSKATGDWIFSVDADEVITGLENLKSKLNHPYRAYRINTRNYTNKLTVSDWHPNTGEYKEETGAGWFSSEKIRLWRNDPRICFEFPVHEVVENSVYFLGWSIVTDYSIQVHHYSRTRDDYEYGHGSKYYDLLHKQFKTGKDDLRSLEQLATQAQGLEKWDDALKFWDEVLKIEPTHATAFQNIGHCHATLGNWPEALMWSHKAWKVKPDCKEIAMNVAICEHMSKGDEQLTEKICEDLIEKHPLYPLPRALLGAIQKIRSNMIYSGGV